MRCAAATGSAVCVAVCCGIVCRVCDVLLQRAVHFLTCEYVQSETVCGAVHEGFINSIEKVLRFVVLRVPHVSRVHDRECESKKSPAVWGGAGVGGGGVQGGSVRE